MKSQLLLLPLVLIMMMSACSTNKATATKNADLKEELIEGTLIHKPWAKSGQSYCAQGSDYWVLKDAEGEEHILQLDDKTKASVKGLDGKKVKLKGSFIERKIKHDPMSQHPVTMGPDGKEIDYYSCTVFKVVEVMD